MYTVISNYDSSMFTRGDSSGPHVHTAMSGLTLTGLGSGSPGERAGGISLCSHRARCFLCGRGHLTLDAVVHSSCLSTFAATPLPRLRYQQATKEAWTLGAR